MKKYIKLLCPLFILFTLIFPPQKTLAAETLPEGGESFDSATKIEALEYSSGSDWVESEDGGQTKYFYIENVNPGQMIDIDAFLKQEEGDTSLEIKIYDGDKEHLANNRTLFGGESFNLSWLAGTEQTSTKYYIRLFSEYSTAHFDLDLSLLDKYDANFNTDAGDNITSALEIEETGEYEGFLGCEWSNDTKDYYKFNLSSSENMTIRLTPDSTAWTYIKVYNDLREEVLSASSESLGSIIETVFEPEESGDYYLMVTREYCENQSTPFSYIFNLRKGGTITEDSSVVETDDDTNLVTGGARQTVSKTWIYIGIGALVLFLAVGGVIIYFIIKSLKKKAEREESIDKKPIKKSVSKQEEGETNDSDSQSKK
jgi:hypothetical protein